MEYAPIVVFALVVPFVAWLFWLMAEKARQARQAEYAAFAARQGFQYVTPEPPGCAGGGLSSLFASPAASDPVGLMPQIEHFSPFDSGHSRHIINFAYGSVGGCNWHVFDYKYTTGSGKNQTTHYLSSVVAQIPVALPGLSISRQGMLGTFGNAIGFKDLQFESDDFNRRFWITTSDQKQAYDLIHPQMMEYLMGLPDRDFQMQGWWIVCNESGTPSVRELERTMIDIAGFVDLIPEYFKQDHGVTPRSI